MAGFAHFFDNEVAGSMHGEKKGGLTPLGREVLRAMEAKGMVVDIAHASHAAVAEMLAMATRPGRLQPWRGAGDVQGQPQPDRR